MQKQQAFWCFATTAVLQALDRMRLPGHLGSNLDPSVNKRGVNEQSLIKETVNQQWVNINNR